MRSGKLDEELQRMSGIVDRIGPQALLLCNESFGSTNEREGSEIARQIVRALLEREVRVVYVTHLFELANSLYRSGMAGALFLRAQRLGDGRRTFRIDVGEPLPTSYGQDLYRKIFVADAQRAPREREAKRLIPESGGPGPSSRRRIESIGPAARTRRVPTTFVELPVPCVPRRFNDASGAATAWPIHSNEESK